MTLFCLWTCIVFLLYLFNAKCDLAGDLQVPVSFSKIPQANKLSLSLIRESTYFSYLVTVFHEQMADNLLTNFIFYSQKYGGSDTSLIPVCPSLSPELQSSIREGGFCTVLDQPIPLDRLILKNVEPIQVTGTCPHTRERLHVNALCVW